MTKAEWACKWSLWTTALVLAGMIFFRLATVYGGPMETISGWRIFQDRQPLQMGSQWK